MQLLTIKVLTIAGAFKAAMSEAAHAKETLLV